MSTVAGNGRTTDVDKGTVGKGESICGGEGKTQRDGKVDRDEGVCGIVQGGGLINGTGELLVGCGGGSAEFNSAGSNGFANGDKVDSILAFGLMV